MDNSTLRRIDTIAGLLNDNDPLDDEVLQHINKKLDDVIEAIQSCSDNPEANDNESIIIWSDGACSGNPGPGGWGTIVKMNGKKHEYSGSGRRTTNNIMEMTGALEGIRRTPEGSRIKVITDSQYLVKGMNEWINNWKKRNWKKSDGNPVLNRDLWIELDEASQKRTIEWIWIKGHDGHPENERCDKLAREAIQH